MGDEREYVSGLTEGELGRLWSELKAEQPELYRRFLDFDPISPDADEEGIAIDGGLNFHIRKKCGEPGKYFDSRDIYWDMKIFFDRHLAK